MAPDLWKVPRPPTELYFQGDHSAITSMLPRLPERGLAIVGSRQCQARSLAMVRATVSRLRGSDLVIVSGLAHGIDTQAHRSALREGLPTLAVLGCGIDRSYPPENESLRAEILDSGGCVVSEFAPGADPHRHHFIRRNRLIAGWTRATWVVEAGFRSGAINTASWAKEQDRFCFVTPCFPGDPTLSGNQRLLETWRVNEGAVRPFWNARSLAEAWLELEGFLDGKHSGIHSSPSEEASRNLLGLIRQEVRTRTLSDGGVLLSDLIHWSQGAQHDPEEFYHALRSALESRAVTLHCGTLTASP